MSDELLAMRGRITTHVDHLPAFSVDPPGVLVLTRHHDGTDTWLTVKNADPEVRFSDELLTEFANGGDNGGMYPDVRLDLQPHDIEQCPERGLCFYGAILHIDARDQHLIYRIGDYVSKDNTWRASWPD